MLTVENIYSSLLSPLSPPDVSIHLQPATFWESGIIKPVGLTTSLIKRRVSIVSLLYFTVEI